MLVVVVYWWLLIGCCLLVVVVGGCLLVVVVVVCWWLFVGGYLLVVVVCCCLLVVVCWLLLLLLFVGGCWWLFVGCLTSHQHASVSQGQICSDNLTCCHTEIDVADQTFYLTQSQYADTRPTGPSTTGTIPAQRRIRTGVFGSPRGAFSRLSYTSDR